MQPAASMPIIHLYGYEDVDATIHRYSNMETTDTQIPSGSGYHHLRVPDHLIPICETFCNSVGTTSYMLLCLVSLYQCTGIRV